MPTLELGQKVHPCINRAYIKKGIPLVLWHIVFYRVHPFLWMDNMRIVKGAIHAP